MEIIRTVEAMQAWSDQTRSEGKRIALVPTMGALHGGHLSLLKQAQQKADVTVASIFVNSLQFEPNEDFERYPREEEQDIKKCEVCGVDVLFIPDEDGFYAPDHSIYVSEGTLSKELCGRSRPHFFQGVCTVVTKLFHIVQPHVAVFGQKDAQQLAVIKRLVRDLHWRINIVTGSTVREEDGLAMSSRNAYLTAEQRDYARAIYQALEKAREMVESGINNVHRLTAEVTFLLSQQRDLRLIYAVIVDPDTMETIEDEITPGHTLIAVAVWCGEVRLIDNILV